MKRLVLSIAIIGGLFSTGCALNPKKVSDEGVDVSAEIEKGDEKAYHPSPEFGTIELEQNPAVQKWVKYFTGRGRRHMERYLQRSTRYIPMMKGVLRERGMPEELVYVPLIESGFNSKAHSHASAVGYWQFIRGTGKRYGLVISDYVDERQDPLLSSKAAADYFTALYKMFGDWYLALAAYNTGEGRVFRAIRRTHSRNFWKLAKKRRLHRETRNYVPKFIAAALIHKDPQKYGFTNLAYHDALEFDEVEISKSISLLTLSKEMGIKYEELQALNPRYRSDLVPIYRKPSVTVRVPKGQGVAAIAGVAKSYSDKPLTKLVRGYYYYRVRRGDTLSHIAQRHRTRVSTLRRLNNMGRRSFLRQGKRLKVPNRYGKSTSVAKAKRKKINRKPLATGIQRHKVRRGQNLSTIAKRYGTNVSTLRRLNKLNRRGLIRVGQRIKVPGAATKVASGAKTPPIVSDKVHVVSRGDNLTEIADKYGITMRELKRVNGLMRRSVIHPGQVLVINPDKKYHVVRRGENLSTIATKYGTSVRKIANVNQIRRRSRIQIGRKLVIPD